MRLIGQRGTFAHVQTLNLARSAGPGFDWASNDVYPGMGVELAFCADGPTPGSDSDGLRGEI